MRLPISVLLTAILMGCSQLPGGTDGGQEVEPVAVEVLPADLILDEHGAVCPGSLFTRSIVKVDLCHFRRSGAVLRAPRITKGNFSRGHQMIYI